MSRWRTAACGDDCTCGGGANPACDAVGACTFGAAAATRVRCACNGKTYTCGTAGAAEPTCAAAMGMALATGDTCTAVGRCIGLGTAVCVCSGTTVTCN